MNTEEFPQEMVFTKTIIKTYTLDFATWSKSEYAEGRTEEEKKKIWIAMLDNQRTDLEEEEQHLTDDEMMDTINIMMDFALENLGMSSE